MNRQQFLKNAILAYPALTSGLAYANIHPSQVPFNAIEDETFWK